jgi:23S rRNA (guanosine2251-2'-O)-methyltransferase
VARHSRRNEAKAGARSRPEPGGKAKREPAKAAAPAAAKGWSPAADRSGSRPPRRPPVAASSDWLWGWHAVTAALANPARGDPRRLVATPERARELAQRFPDLAGAEPHDGADIARLLPPGAAHQGVALKAAPIEPYALADLAAHAHGVLVMLDQVTDPQNVGAVFRSAAAFGARGVVIQDRHAPPFTGALAKAAAGALDAVPHARVVNLARALDELERLGWRTVGLAGDAEAPLAAVLDARPTVLVLGSEGEGLRRLVGEHCDALARIPMPGGFESLNVAAAAAIALYEATRSRSSTVA